MNAVVHAAQQHGLIAQGDTGVGQTGKSLLGLGGELVGMVEMGVEPDGMIFLQHLAQLGGNTLRADHWGTAAETDNLHMRNLAKALDDIFQFLVRNHQAVAAREQHVAYLRSLLNISQALLDTLAGTLVVLLSGETTAGAVAAVHRAHIGDKEEHTIRIAMGQAGSGRILVLMQRVVEVGRGDIALLAGGDGLTADGVVRVVGVNKTQVVRSDSHTELGQSLLDTLGLFGREGEVLAQFLIGLDAVLHLPFPVVPLLVADVREQFFSAVDFHICILLFQSLEPAGGSPLSAD